MEIEHTVEQGIDVDRRAFRLGGFERADVVRLHATRVPELWLIPADGKPRPVGLLHADQTVTLTLPPDLAVFAKNNAVLAVSLEPPGGSPTGQPTGPVIATGKLTTYPGRSKYQIVVDRMELAGEGALLALLERRRKVLAAEGLFDAARKRKLPFLPQVIGVVTSPTGAVIRDILHRLEDRCPTRVILWPVAVQGEGAAARIAQAIREFATVEPRPDLLIVAREDDLNLAAAVALCVLDEVPDRAPQQPLVAVDDDAACAVDVRADVRRFLRRDGEQVDTVAMEKCSAMIR